MKLRHYIINPLSILVTFCTHEVKMVLDRHNTPLVTNFQLHQAHRRHVNLRRTVGMPECCLTGRPPLFVLAHASSTFLHIRGHVRRYQEKTSRLQLYEYAKFNVARPRIIPNQKQNLGSKKRARSLGRRSNERRPSMVNTV